MLVLIGGLLVVSFLYFVTVMKKDDDAADVKLDNSAVIEENLQAADATTTNMECSQTTIPRFVCSICGSRPVTIKIEERIEDSKTTTTCEIIEENNTNNSNSYFSLINNNKSALLRVPFPEAGVDIVDRKLKNTEDAFERELDEYCSSNDILTYSESWTENWLFRKKNDNSSSTTFKRVSMFVPNTTAKYRALIGDRDVDEISDDDDNDDNEEKEEEEEEEDDIPMMTSDIQPSKYIYENGVLIDDKSKQRRIVDSIDDNQTTYSKDLAMEKNSDEVLLQESIALNDLASESNRSYRSELFIETLDVNQNSLSDDKLSDIDFNLFSPPKPGTIADREHRKWQTAVPMENNPYSEANLQRRLLEKNSYGSKYSSASSLLGIARINGLDDVKCVDMDFERLDNLLTEAPIGSERKSIDKSNINFCNGEHSIVSESPAKSPVVESNEIKNKSKLSSNGLTMKNHDVIVDCNCEEKISLPSVKKLVEVFNKKEDITIEMTTKLKDKNSCSDTEIVKSKFKRIERNQHQQQQSPRPLYLHSLTARSLSKQFREGLR